MIGAVSMRVLDRYFGYRWAAEGLNPDRVKENNLNFLTLFSTKDKMHDIFLAIATGQSNSHYTRSHGFCTYNILIFHQASQINHAGNIYIGTY